MKLFLLLVALCYPVALSQSAPSGEEASGDSSRTPSPAIVISPGGLLRQDPGPLASVTGIVRAEWTLDFAISHPSGGTVKSWFILAPPRALCTLRVDGTIRYAGRFGNLFMSRASVMPNATGNNGFTSRYFSVTNTAGENGHTAGHNAYFDIPFGDSVNVRITGDTTWVAFYNVFYEVGRRPNGRYSEFYAATADSIPMDAARNDTLLSLRSVGRGAYWSLYYWMLSDSAEENNRAYEERDFYCVTDGRTVHLSTGTEDYCGYYYNWQSAATLGSPTTDFHGSPTFGKRTDRRYLDAFYRIHELDAIPFENDFTFYWEAWDGWPRIPRSRHCHVGYAIIYYLERPLR